MMANFWNDNAWTPGKHTLVDLGYLNCKDARDRLDRLIAAGLGRANFQVVGYGRLIVRLPPTKVSKLMSRFRGIKPVTAGADVYCDCTHVWATARSLTRKYAMRGEG